MIRKVLLSPMNMSVKNTLYLSLFTMNLLLILIAVFSWMAFHSAGRTTRIIADELIPVTEAVSSLTHMNAELSAIVSGLVFIAKQDDLEDKYEMARKILSRQQEILAELRQEYGAAGGETEYHDVNLYSMQLEKKLEILNRKMASRLDLLDQLKEKAKTLFAAHADFIVGVSPIADDAQFDLTMGLEGVRQDSEGENDLIRQVETLSRVLELKAEGNLLVGFLEIAINMQDGAGLPPLIERFDASLSRLESDMADLSLQEREGFQLVTEAAGVIMGLGTTGSSVFELRKQYLALQDQLTSELMEVEEIGRLIDGSVSELSEKIKESVNKTRERSEILMSWGRYTILVVSLLSVLLSVMVSWFYVKGRIVSRLEHLKGLMMALANKDFNKIIEISHVSDEIGEMETALHTFREKLIEKEKLVRDVEEQKNRTEAIINHMNEGLITIDERGFVMSFNAGAEKMFGYQAGEVIGQNINMLIPHSQKDTDRSVPAQIKSDLGTRQELTALRKNGDEFPVALSVATTNVSGLPIFISIIQDVSEQKMRESLLHQAKNQAEEASRAKSDFLANMSHEIRTPMNAVMGMSALLLDTPLNEEQTEWARAINASGSSLLNIINDIIDISKIEAGKLTLEKIDFDLFDILQEVANLYTFQAREKGLEMLLDIDPDLPEFMVGDPVRIKQIFANLISNALKFTTRGHILIKLSHKGEQEGGIRMECRVEDTGIGIPKSKQKKIFEKFTQAEESTTRKFGGTGLGLTIVSQLVGIMGGSIRVESVEGRGSVFIFEVMLGNSLKNIDKPGELQKEAGAVNALVVDDYALTRFMLKELLERAGIICAEAASAEQAEEILKEHGPYDVCLIDYCLGGDGWIVVHPKTEARQGI
ncbi:MAG: ATP-binding protein [Alphaproteobacteria bacterium]|nr:ATP-binding protein [Alphaproteobacteria bacterium]